MRSAGIELVPLTAPACQVSMEMGRHVEMSMSAKSRFITAVDMHSAQTISVATIAHATMGLRVPDGRVLTLTSVQPRLITAVYMRSVETISVPSIASAVMDLRVTDGCALTLMSARLKLTAATLKPVALTT